MRKTFYKAAITNIFDGRKDVTSVLCQDYKSIESATKEAKTHVYGDRYSLEVREYSTEPGGRAIIAFGQPFDTGKTVYQEEDVAV